MTLWLSYWSNLDCHEDIDNNFTFWRLEFLETFFFSSYQYYFPYKLLLMNEKVSIPPLWVWENLCFWLNTAKKSEKEPVLLSEDLKTLKYILNLHFRKHKKVQHILFLGRKKLICCVFFPNEENRERLSFRAKPQLWRIN